MLFNLWSFLAILAVSASLMLIFCIRAWKQVRFRELEVEGLKIKETNLKNAVDDAVNRNLKEIVGRLEVLEAIVTDKKYDLNEKITRLKQ